MSPPRYAVTVPPSGRHNGRDTPHPRSRGWLPLPLNFDIRRAYEHLICHL